MDFPTLGTATSPPPATTTATAFSTARQLAGQQPPRYAQQQPNPSHGAGTPYHSGLKHTASFGQLQVAVKSDQQSAQQRQRQVSFDDGVVGDDIGMIPMTPGLRTPGGSRRKSVVAVAREKASAMKEHRFLRNTVMRRRSSISSAVSSIPASRRVEYTQAFNLFAPDSNGKVAAESIARVLHTLGWSPDVESLKMLVAEVDYNGDGAIGLDEFMVMLHGPPRSTRDVAAVLGAFKSMAFDSAGLGKISVKRLRVLLQHVGMRIQPAVVDALLEDATRMQHQQESQLASDAEQGGGQKAALSSSPPPSSPSSASSSRGCGTSDKWDYAELVRLISNVELSSKMFVGCS